MVDVRFWHLADIENRHLLRAAKAREREEGQQKAPVQAPFAEMLIVMVVMVVMMTEVMMVVMIHSHTDATVVMMMVVVADLDRYLRQPSCVICPRLCETCIIGFQ